jgi:hypothetical protein
MLKVHIYELDVGSDLWSEGPGTIRRFVAAWEHTHLGRFLGRGSSRQEALDALVVAIRAYMQKKKILSLESIQLNIQLKEEPETIERPTRFDHDNVI